VSEQKPLFQDIPQLAFLTDLESELGVAPAFFHGLLDEDDWSFVIKLHSLIEAAATHLLIVTMDKLELETIISRLELSGQTTGKLAFFKSMELLDSPSRRFIQTLSEVRNKLVHDVSNISINLEQYISNLKEEDKKGFDTGFKWGYKDESKVKIKRGEDGYDVHEFIKLIAVILMKHSQYKLAIWFGSIIVLRQMYAKVSHGHFEKQMKEIDDKLISLIMQLGQGIKDEPEPQS
jgi:hypothetical protein